MDKSQVILDGPEGYPKGQILSDAAMPVAKRMQQRGGSVMIWVVIVNQIIIGPFS